MAITATLESLFLLGLAFLTFPLSLACLIVNFACLSLVPQKSLRRRIRKARGFKPRKILITGASSPEGLRLARAFNETGHDVIGADQEPQGVPIPARWSSALLRFYKLKQNDQESSDAKRTQELLAIILKEAVELWIECPSNYRRPLSPQAKQTVERSSRCICFIASASEARNFASQSNFLAFARSHELPVPEKYKVKSRDDIHKVLNKSQGKRQYVLNAPDDKTATWPRSQTLLPRRTLSQTYHEVARLKITKSTPLLLEQYIDGLDRCKTIAVVVHGKIKAFVASAVYDSNCQQSIPSTSLLNQALLRCVQNIVRKLEADFSSHLCIDFCIDEKVTDAGVEKSILPIDGRDSIEPTILLFQGVNGSLDLARSYLSVINPSANGSTLKNGLPISEPDEVISMPTNSDNGVYVLGNDLRQFIFRPLLRLLALKIGPAQCARQVVMLLNHLLFWQEAMYDFKDPLPVWYLYQLYLPGRLLLHLFSKAGKTVNHLKAR